MNSKQAPAKPKADTQASHPEVQNQRAKSGTPGPERSQAPDTVKDTRNRHDQDGNSAQQKR